MNKTGLAVVGVGQRGCAFVRMAMEHPDVELLGICDASEERLNDFARNLNCSAPRFSSLQRMLEETAPQALVITVPDFEHADAALAGLKAGCAIMLEKPMAPTAAECRKIIRAGENGIIQLGFVLREHPLYRKIQQIVATGVLGDMLNVTADESIGVMHGASYMRRWHRKVKNSGGFMLAKCSHDLDIISWIVGAQVKRVASFGSIDFFKPEKMKASHCSQCGDAACRFRFKGEMVVMADCEKQNPAARNFDLCVYNDDKDVVDHQVAILEFTNGVMAAFALNLFAPEAKRTIKIVGSAGYLEADDVSRQIRVSYSDGRPGEVIDCPVENASGHGGSDLAFFNEFLDCVRNGIRPHADMRAGLASTVLGNAIEEARREGRVVNIPPEAYLI